MDLHKTKTKKRFFIYTYFIFLLLFFGFFTKTIYANVNTDNWYQYNGYSKMHSFSVNFPQNWRVYTSDKTHILSPRYLGKQNPQFTIREFEGVSYKQAMNFFVDSDVSLIKVEDFVLEKATGDFLAKKATYLDKVKNIEIEKTFIKKGSLILILIEKENGRYNQVTKSIYNSFNFTNSWEQHIDMGNKYTFIFPEHFSVKKQENSTKVLFAEREIFTIKKYEDEKLEDISKILDKNFRVIENKEIFFNGDEGRRIIVRDRENSSKERAFIFLKRNNNLFKISDVNIEQNFPRLDIYNSSVIEILVSFEFFNMDNDDLVDENLQEKEDNNENAKIIKYLISQKIIQEYKNSNLESDKGENEKESESESESEENYEEEELNYNKEKIIKYLISQRIINSYKQKIFSFGEKINTGDIEKILKTIRVVFSFSGSEGEGV